MVFLFRYFGGYENGLASALSDMNVFSPIFDGICENVLHVLRHKDSIVASFELDLKNILSKKEKEEQKEEVSEKQEEQPETEETVSEEEIVEVDLSKEEEEPEEEEAVQ